MRACVRVCKKPSARENVCSCESVDGLFEFSQFNFLGGDFSRR